MVRFMAAAAFAATASAAALQRRVDGCGFQIQSSGGVTGKVGQLDDGQNRINGSYPAATYYISNGGITDSAGRPCVVTTTNDATHQFQCDLDSPEGPTPGFTIGSDGSISFNGYDQFYACPATDHEYNVYTSPLKGQDKCVAIKLSTVNSACTTASTGSSFTGYYTATTPAASVYKTTEAKTSAPVYSTPKASVETKATVYSAKSSTPVESKVVTSAPIKSVYSTTVKSVYSTPAASVPASTVKTSAPVESKPAVTVTSVVKSTVPATSAPAYSAPASSAPASSKIPATSTTNKVCQTTLGGSYQTPHLITWMNSSKPDTASGTQYNADITSDTSTVFNFDIPASYKDMTCTVIFLFPELKDLETSSWTWNSKGSIDFAQLSSVVTEETTYDTCPAVKTELNSVAIKAGSSYIVSSGACQAGEKISIEASSVSGLDLEFFEDWNPSPLGLYITAC